MNMKKIVLALALGIACLVQASSVKWGLLSPVDAGGNKYRVWTFVAADSSGTTAAGKLLSLADAISMLENGDWATLKTYNTKAGTLAADGTFSSATTADNDKWVQSAEDVLSRCARKRLAGKRPVFPAVGDRIEHGIQMGMWLNKEPVRKCGRALALDRAFKCPCGRRSWPSYRRRRNAMTAPPTRSRSPLVGSGTSPPPDGVCAHVPVGVTPRVTASLSFAKVMSTTSVTMYFVTPVRFLSVESKMMA